MKVRLPLGKARAIANDVRDHLASTGLFSQVHVAGSVRRQRPEVGDAEIVAQATPGGEFLREQTIRRALEAVGVVRATPTARPNQTDAEGRPVLVKAPWGPRYYKGSVIFSGGPFQIDLFVVLPPAEWGPVFTIRTGSREFSQAFVTRLHRWGLKSDAGHVVKIADGSTIPCSTEDSFFRYNRLEWIPPEHREPGDPVSTKAFAGET